MPAARPDTPVEIGRPVPFVSVTAEGVPRFGVVRVGEVPKTRAPEPVSSVTAVTRFAEEGVARNEATPAARPDTSVVISTDVPSVVVSVEPDNVRPVPTRSVK